jgi:phosphate transport system permease protein
MFSKFKNVRSLRGAAACRERWVVNVFRGATYFVLLCGAFVIGTIVVRGLPSLVRPEFPFINTAFLTEAPETLHVFERGGVRHELGDRAFRAYVAEVAARGTGGGGIENERAIVYSAGGVFPNIIGTLLLVSGAMAIALFLGISSAVYLNEYARPSRMVSIIRLAVLNLAGVPSIVFGLFGLGLFVIYFKCNVSLLAGWFTLAFMALPVVITASEEALKAVPNGFREGSLALGAGKWQTIRRMVLPCALPGILTSSILGIARVAGETAPIMFTAAYAMRDSLPWEVGRVVDFLFQGVMALPYHIYVVSSKIPQNEFTERVQYGAALVFLVLVALFAATSVLLRNRLRRGRKW